MLGFYLTLICNVTGNPKPTVQWYHDGKLIEYDWIVKYKEPKLLIHTFEEKDKGIYQCVATNVAGEAQTTGLVTLKPKQHADPPRNPKCLPINATTLKVIFEGPQNYRVCTTMSRSFIEQSFSYYQNQNLYNLFVVVVVAYFIVVGYHILHGQQTHTELVDRYHT